MEIKTPFITIWQSKHILEDGTKPSYYDKWFTRIEYGNDIRKETVTKLHDAIVYSETAMKDILKTHNIDLTNE